MKYAAFLLPLLLTSFQYSDSIDIELLHGVWVETEYANETYTFNRAKAFHKKKPGIEFKKGGKLLKRQNAGWCGTPPITYTNNEGSWSIEPDATLRLSYQFWGGTINTTWQVQQLDRNTLEARVLEFKTEK